MQSQRKSKLLRVTAALLYFLAAASFLWAFLSHGGAIFSLFGVVVGAAGAATLRLSRTQPESLKTQQFRQAWVLKPWLFIVGVALAIPVVVALAWMFQEAANGYRGSAIPIYMFAISAVVCGAWWAAIFARWQQRPRI
jgi:hypothetical protein